MSFNVAMLKQMQAEGLSFDAAIRVLEAAEVRRDPTAAERKRRQRERDKSRRDVTRDEVSPNEVILTPSGTDSPDEASASSPSRQPISEAFGIWNEVAPLVGWPTARELSPNRGRLLGARLRQHGLVGWKAAIARARASPFLAGPDPPSWFTFDFLIKAGNFLKVIEGNYDRRHADNSDPTAVALSRLHAFSGSVGAIG